MSQYDKDSGDAYAASCRDRMNLFDQQEGCYIAAASHRIGDHREGSSMPYSVCYAGLAAKGRSGRQVTTLTPEKAARARQLIASGLNVCEAAARVKVSKSALYTALKDCPALAG